jgi:hypothetical protein
LFKLHLRLRKGFYVLEVQQWQQCQQQKSHLKPAAFCVLQTAEDGMLLFVDVYLHQRVQLFKLHGCKAL